MAQIRRFRMTHDFFSEEGLRTLAGVRPNDYEAFILKELMDNALDALENQDAKRVAVWFRKTGDTSQLAILDNGPGLPGNLLDQIYTQFDSYLSSKKGYRAPTRGYQGNALKTVIGICFLRNFELAFQTRERERVAYVPDPNHPSGEIGFSRKALGEADGPGVLVSGHFEDLTEDDILFMLKKYRLCNPDVSFSYNESWRCEARGATKRKETSYISWYDLPSFEALVTNSAYVSPRPGQFAIAGEHLQKKQPQRLCERISQDLAIDLSSEEEPLPRLNGLLAMPDLIGACREKNIAFSPSPEITTLDRLTSSYRREAFERLSDAEQGYITWLNRALLEALYQAEFRKAPRTTVRAFLESNFSQVQKIVKHLAVSGVTLTDLAADPEKISNLFYDLQQRVKPPRDQILKPYCAGEEKLRTVLGPGFYRACFDHYEVSNEDGSRTAVTRIPFAVEAYLAQGREGTKFDYGKQLIVAVNNSVPQEDDPFRFRPTDTLESKDFNRLDAMADLRTAIRERFSLEVPKASDGLNWLNSVLKSEKFWEYWVDRVCDFLDEELPLERLLLEVTTDLEQKCSMTFGYGEPRDVLNATLRMTDLYQRLDEPSLPADVHSLARSTTDYRERPFDELTPLAKVAVKEFNAALLHALYPHLPARKRLALPSEVAGLMGKIEAMPRDRRPSGSELREITRLNRLLLEATFGKGLGSAPAAQERQGSLTDYVTGKKLGDDCLLYVSLICPCIEVRDKAKTFIIADRFRSEILASVEAVLRRLPRKEEGHPARQKIAALMRQYLQQAYDHASSNGRYLVMARQVYYPLRDFINTREGVMLSESNYNSFTQQRITEFFEEYPDYEGKILFERRGSFKDPQGHEVHLGTAEVGRFVQAEHSNKVHVITESKTTPSWDFSPEHLYNRVLFVEKGGYRDILEEAGLLTKLNMGVMSTQGFGTRAGKELIQSLRSKGIQVYVLHDCDIPGYQIMHNLTHRSATFREPLDVTEIGLTVAQVQELRKERRAAKAGAPQKREDPEAEVVVYTKNYDHSLQTLIATEEARRFFTASEDEIREVVSKDNRMKERKEKSRYYYKRVELNALTSEELITLIEREILRIEKNKGIAQPEPTAEDLRSFLSEIADSGAVEEIKKRALYEAFEEAADTSIDTEEIVRRILWKMGEREHGKGHWTACLRKAVEEYMEKAVQELVKKLNGKKSADMIDQDE